MPVNDVATALAQGLPVLAGQLALTLGLLGLGMAAYLVLTPFDEWRLVREGNTAAGVVAGGTLLALAIPLAATLATRVVTLDILIWGVVALLIQLVTFAAAAAVMRGLRGMIEAGNVAAALVLVSIQIAVALLNAGAMAG